MPEGAGNMKLPGEGETDFSPRAEMSNEQVLYVHLVSLCSGEAQFINFKINLPSTHAPALNLGLRWWPKMTLM